MGYNRRAMSRLDPVRRHREARALTQAELATRAGISRQALGAIEAGRVDPSLSVMLALAEALGVTLDALVAAAGVRETVACTGDGAIGQRVVLSIDDERRAAHGLGPADGNQPADGCVRAAGRDGLMVELFGPPASRQIVVPGCLPLLGGLTQRLNATRREARWAWTHRTSAQALAALARGDTQVAGVHGEPRRGDKRLRVPIVAWESGLIVAPGNPKRFATVADLARPRVKVALREPGAETRRLLERLAHAAGLEVATAFTEAYVAVTHADVARAVAFGVAHVGFGPRAAALAAGLDFVPLAEERFDLVVADDAVDEAPLSALLELARSGAFRRDAEALGYELPAVGER